MDLIGQMCVRQTLERDGYIAACAALPRPKPPAPTSRVTVMTAGSA